jgi:pimeloyl-ACP methyl ester carboxylesterase
LDDAPARHSPFPLPATSPDPGRAPPDPRPAGPGAAAVAGSPSPSAAPVPAFPREYGGDGPLVLLLHGGPGAPGALAPVARALADRFHVLEWAERRAGGAGAPPLTVAGHLADLRALLEARVPGARPALVGHSSGAMLALAFAAAFPYAVRAVVLVGCGTFDPVARQRVQANVAARVDERARAALAAAEHEPDPDERMRRRAEALLRAYACDVDTGAEEPAWVDAGGQQQTWADLLRLQTEGEHPAAFARIVAPVLMLHGAEDPHPGELIRRALAPHIRRLEYVELARCGHEPWRERWARAPFLQRLRSFLAETAGPDH